MAPAARRHRRPFLGRRRGSRTGQRHYRSAVAITIPRSPTTSCKAAQADPEQRAATPTAARIDIFTGGSQLQNDTVYGNSATGGAGTTPAMRLVAESRTIREPPIQGLSLLNVTVAFNTAQAGAAYGGGLNNDSGDASLGDQQQPDCREHGQLWSRRFGRGRDDRSQSHRRL